MQFFQYLICHDQNLPIILIFLLHCDVLLVVGVEIELHHASKNIHDINTLKEMIY
jgi:hypothetical protein